MVRRLIRPPRRVFIGVEGEGEAGFIAWLKRIAEARRMAVHYRVSVLQGGDPLHMVQRAVRARAMEADRYPTSVIVIDADVQRRNADRDHKARALARREGFTLLLQVPDHEAVLLRLHQGHERDQPTTPAMRALQRVWPDYRKPATRQILDERFTAADLERARRHDAFLDALLNCLQLR